MAFDSALAIDVLCRQNGLSTDIQHGKLIAYLCSVADKRFNLPGPDVETSQSSAN